MMFELSAGSEGSVPSTVVRVVVADDSAAMLHRLESFVETLGNFSVVGTATNGFDAWDSISKLKPDLALLDFQMPGLSGADIATRVRASGLSTVVLILSLYDGPEVRACCLSAGASGFVSKLRLSAELPGELGRLIKPPKNNL